MSESKPDHAYIFPNGMIAVFDQFGQQVPEYQGPVDPNLIRLQKDHPACRVESARWDGSRDNPIVRN